LYQTVAAETSGTASTTWSRGQGVQTQPTYSGVSEIVYSPNWIYIRTTGLASHMMGPWYLDAAKTQLFPNFPANVATIYRIPRTPSVPATKVNTGLGVAGYFVNGVALFDMRDAFSYNTGGGPGCNADEWPARQRRLESRRVSQRVGDVRCRVRASGGPPISLPRAIARAAPSARRSRGLQRDDEPLHREQRARDEAFANRRLGGGRAPDLRTVRLFVANGSGERHRADRLRLRAARWHQRHDQLELNRAPHFTGVGRDCAEPLRDTTGGSLRSERQRHLSARALH
jgi:hypothetical protein